MTTTKNQTQIVADPNLPTVEIIREFDATPEQVHRAWTDPELIVRWLGPRSIDMTIQKWDCRTGGEYRYTASRGGEEIAHFYGSFHQIRPDRLVQTFGFDEMPDAVSLDTITFEDLGDGRTRTVGLSVVFSMEARDAMMASGMDVGVTEGYEKLDELFAAQSQGRS